MSTKIEIDDHINPLGSLEDQGAGSQLKNDVENPGSNKIYGTDSNGDKGWVEGAIGQVKTYKALSNFHADINRSTTPITMLYKAAAAGTYDTNIFTPVANGVQLLVDLENVQVIGTIFMEDPLGTRLDIGLNVTLDGTPSLVEFTHYLRGINGHNESSNIAIETFSSLPAGTVITITGKRLAEVSNLCDAIEDKGMFSVMGTVATGEIIPPDAALSAPVITSVTII